MDLESVLFWIAVVGYAISMLALLIGLLFHGRSIVDVSLWVAVVAFGGHTASILARWASTGRLPYIQDYENALAGSWFIVAAFLGLVMWRRRLWIGGVVVLPFAMLTLGYGLTVTAAPGVITPAYRSVWLAVHVLFAWATYAAYTSAAALGGIELMKTRKKWLDQDSLSARSFSADIIPDLTFRLVTLGFLVNAVMIASGAIWAYELWGSYWRWDPVETWSLLTWLAFGFYMHARLTLGWRGKRLAWIAVFALFGVMMSFWGVQFAPTSYHLFRDLGGTLMEMSRVR